jgi:hypothetical protein
MYNPDQHYVSHTLHLRELSEQAERSRMSAALPRLPQATLRAAARRLSVQLGVQLVRLGTWLARGAQPEEQPA